MAGHQTSIDETKECASPILGSLRSGRSEELKRRVDLSCNRETTRVHHGQMNKRHGQILEAIEDKREGATDRSLSTLRVQRRATNSLREANLNTIMSRGNKVSTIQGFTYRAQDKGGRRSIQGTHYRTSWYIASNAIERGERDSELWCQRFVSVPKMGFEWSSSVAENLTSLCFNKLSRFEPSNRCRCHFAISSKKQPLNRPFCRFCCHLARPKLNLNIIVYICTVYSCILGYSVHSPPVAHISLASLAPDAGKSVFRSNYHSISNLTIYTKAAVSGGHSPPPSTKNVASARPSTDSSSQNQTRLDCHQLRWRP